MKGVFFARNTYAAGGSSIEIDPRFTDGTDTTNEINGGCKLKLTQSRQNVAHPIVPTT